MRKTTQESEKKVRLMNAAESFMLDKGYEATTVDQICGDAGVTKGGFFYFFKNKEDLGQQLLTRFSCKNGETLMAEVMAAGPDPLDRVYAYVDSSIKLSQDPDNKGCLVGTFAQELHDSHPEIQATCGAIFQQFISHFKKDLQIAKKKYVPHKRIDTEGLAQHFVSTIQGSFVVMKATKDRQVIAKSLKHYKNYLQLVFES